LIEKNDKRHGSKPEWIEKNDKNRKRKHMTGEEKQKLERLALAPGWELMRAKHATQHSFVYDSDSGILYDNRGYASDRTINEIDRRKGRGWLGVLLNTWAMCEKVEVTNVWRVR